MFVTTKKSMHFLHLHNRGCSCPSCTNRAKFSHRFHRTHRNLLLRYSPTDCTDGHRLGGYGIPAIPTQTPNYLPTEATEPYAA